MDSHATEPAPAGTPEPGASSRSSKWLVLLSIGVGTFMSALDGSVVNTILPVVGKTFGGSIATIEWVVVVYLLVVSGLLLSAGRLGDMRGHKPVYLSGFVIFILSSAACGLAGGPAALIASRGVQAIGAAMLFANSPAILTRNFPASQRGQALGMLATMTYLGLTVGPSLGGWLAGSWSWRAVFFVNVPIGALALVLGQRFIPSDSAREPSGRFDRLGAALYMSGLVALLLALNQGHRWGWLSGAVLGLVASSAALLALFIQRQRTTRNPVLDLSLFRNRIFGTSLTSAVLNYICVSGVTFLLSFYLIQGRGFTPAHAGLILTAQPVLMVITAPISGTLSDRIGSRLLAVAGMTVLAVGLVLLSRIDPGTPMRVVAVALAVVGFGTGMFISPNNSALMGSAPRRSQGIAAGMLATARNTGMVLGVGLAGAILTTLQSRSAGEAGFFGGVHLGFIVLSALAVLGGITSAARGSAPRQGETD
jgi:EmrB/QacA subfamily drug resistance transporter